MSIHKKSIIQLREELDNIEHENENRKGIEEIYEDDIGNGRYQIKVTILFALHYIWNAIFILTPGLFFQLPFFLCNGQTCKEKEYCSLPENQRSIDPNSPQSIATEFELYCSKDYLVSLGSSMSFLGEVFGLLIFMMVSDNKGRRFSIAISLTLITIGGIFIVAFKNIVTIFIGFFLAGLGFAPASFLEVVFLGEITTGHFRSAAMCFMYVTFGLGELLIWPLSIGFPDWRDFNLYVLTIPYVLFNFMFLLFKESPKYLQQKDLDKTADVLNQMAIENKKDIMFSSKDIEIVDSGNLNNYHYGHLFKYASLRKITIGICTLSFGIHALYYGMQFSLDLIGSNFAKNAFFVGIADFAGYTASDFICPKFPRKKWLNITLFVCSAFCFSFAIDPVPQECIPDDQSCTQKTAQIAQAMCARFVVSFSFSFMIIWMNELYPTTIRSIGVGCASSVGLFGAYITPFIKQLCESIGVNFVVVCGAFGILGCIPTFFLDETFNVPLKQEIQELTRRFSIKQSMIGSKTDEISIQELDKQEQMQQQLLVKEEITRESQQE